MRAMYRCSNETYSLGYLPEVDLSGELKGLAVTLSLANSLEEQIVFALSELELWLGQTRS